MPERQQGSPGLLDAHGLHPRDREPRGEHPDRARAHYKRAKAYSNVVVGWGRTFADYSQAIRLQPDFKEAYVDRADLLLKRREYHAALADCLSATRVAPEWPRAYLCQARAYSGKGDTRRALQAYHRAVDLSDEAPMVQIWERVLTKP